jgi:hypothetical protein
MMWISLWLGRIQRFWKVSLATVIAAIALGQPA